MNTDYLLEVSNLAKSYTVSKGLMRKGSLQAVDNVSFQVSEKETLALVGESGCGKTTIGKCILKLVKFESGTIVFEGQEIQDLATKEFRSYRKNIQMVFQDPLGSFNPMMKVNRALIEPLRLLGEMQESEYYQEVERLLGEVQLDASFGNAKPKQMSGGQLQRVGIARAIASQPKLVFLDEPTSALDMSIRGQIVNLLIDLQQQKRLSYVLVTHDLRLVHAMADRVLVMYLGEIVEEGLTEDVLNKPLHPYTIGLLSAAMLGTDSRIKHTDSKVHLDGEITSTPIEGRGCRLYERCPFSVDRCANELQEMMPVLPGRRVRCWRALDIQDELLKLTKADKDE